MSKNYLTFIINKELCKIDLFVYLPQKCLKILKFLSFRFYGSMQSIYNQTNMTNKICDLPAVL